MTLNRENTLTAKEKYLKPHPLRKHLTFEEFCLEIPKFYFKKEVPDDVVKNFEVVESLLAHSYFEYKFIDEAWSKSLLTLEMAMKFRYRDFFELKGRINFDNLITRLSKLNLFETEMETLKWLKSTRNHFSHPDRHSFGGIVYWNRIEFAVRLINEMYEDVNLRLERWEMAKKIFNQLQVNQLEKSLLMSSDKKETILYNLRLLFINNKISSPEFLFAYFLSLTYLNQKKILPKFLRFMS